ncbi:MAG: IS1634 family transposase [Nitrospirae bacterium]|nr:IS1634 family transposase [Nitrospirota bacterium]
MYFRIKRQKSKDGKVREYLCVAKSERNGRQVRQKTLVNLGRLDELKESGNLNRLAAKLNELVGKQMLVDLTRDITPGWSKHFGVIQAFKGIWKKLDISRVLLEEEEISGKEFSFHEAILAMVINRLVKPSSKLETWRWKDRVYEPAWETLNLQHFYRAMDYLLLRKDAIEEALLKRSGDLFGKQVDLVLFDTTTIKYWGEASDSLLLKHGYSKEKRMDLRQIIIGVLMSQDGFPLGHEVWEGNQSDIKSLKIVVSRLRDRYEINRVVIVCDRGMVSDKNLREIEEAGYEYIVGVKMRSLDASKKNVLLSMPGFEPVKENLWVKEQKLEGRRYLVCYNPVEAEYQAKQREYFKAIIEKKVADYSFKDWIVKNGYRKYINLEGKDFQITMDYERLKEEPVYDGKWVLLTNSPYSSRECALYYKSLSQVEQGFRVLKKEIQTGPIYHWTTRRIQGHVFICFLALVVKVAFRKSLQALNPGAICSEVIQALKDVKAMKFKIKDRILIMRAELPELAHLGFQASGIRIPGEILYLSPENVVPTSAQNLVTH